ncbi:MAG: choice-of-anchor D domain-containing protein, partial [Candidatus Cloacimonetes bacterium]|nr:choice-of-anchor D domain-containing protein [Candidatus Cloacimonadota bacterium]
MKKFTFMLVLLMVAGLLMGQVVLNEGFEGGVIPEGWTQENVVGSALWTVNTGADGGNVTSAKTGTKNLKFVSTSGTNSPITQIITPVIDISSLTAPKLSFWYAQENWFGDQNELKVYYRVDNESSWIELFYDNSNINVWTEVDLDLPNSSATYQIAFEGINNYGRANVIDDVMVYAPLSSPLPATLISPTDEAIDVNLTQTLNWQATSGGATPEGYKIYVGTSDTPSAHIDINDVTTYSPTLAYGTTYYWQVIPYVGAEDAADCPVWSFTTMADPTISTFPWTEGFDTWPPVGWDLTGGTRTVLHYNVNNVTAAKANFWSWQIGNTAYMTTPPISLGPNMYIFKFDWSHLYSSSYPNDALTVEITTDGGQTWNQLFYATGQDFNSNDGADSTTPGSFITETFNITEYNENIVYLRFFFQSGWGPDAFIDNITIEEVPNYPIAQINPQNKDFEVVLINTTETQTYTIMNVGGQPLVVSDISISGDSEFSLENYENTTLGFLESLTFDLVYSPITSGNHSAVLSITDNTGRQTYNYDITGEGYDPTITADSHPENFDDIDDPYFLLGWGAYVDSISESALIGLSTTSPNSAPNHLRMYNYSDEDAVLIATSPIVENINNRRVRFFAKGGANYSLIVGTMSDQGDPETFIPLETIIMSDASYTEYVVYLEDATQGCIAFKHGLGGTYRSIYIDDVVIELIPDGLISSNQIPYVDGFEENNIHNSTNVHLWRQELVEETTKYWTVNETNTSFNREPRTGDYNVTLHQDGEAWLFRPVELTSGVFYDIELFARQNTDNPENANISLYYGNSPQISAMTNVLNAGVELVDGEYQRILARFPASNTGTYYVGIKGVISAPANYLSIDDFGVSLTPTTPVYNVNPTEWAAGTHEVLTFVEQVFTVRNVGVGNLNIQNIQLSGNPSFTISVLPNMPQNISVEQELTFTVKYAPINASSHTATISILGANNAVHGTIPLTGTGFIPLAGTNFRYPHNFTLPVSDFQSNTELYDNIYDSSMIDPNSVYLNGYDFVSKFTLTEDSYLTGSVSGSWTGLFILNQEPNAESPAPVYGFAGSSSGGSFTDLKLIAGTYYAVVSTYPSPYFSDFILNLSATPATGEPLFAINPVDYNEEDDVYTHTFAQTATGASNATEFTVTNAGAGLFGIYSVFVEGDDSFTVTDLPLLPQNINFMNNSFVKFNVNYNPASAGTHTATLKIIEDQTRTVHEVELTGTANTVVVSVALLDEGFSDSSFPGGWLTFNAGSGNDWTVASTGGNPGATMKYSYNSSHPANAWAFSSGLDLTAGIQYTIEFDQKVQSDYYAEKLAVYIGTAQTVAGQTTQLYDENNLLNTVWATHSVSFTPSVSGIYYLGFNCYSDENQYNLYVDNVKVAPVLPFVTSPGSVDFGTIAFGSEASTQNIAFLNNTDSEFNVTAITLVGTNANDFQLVNTPELPYALEAQGANFGSVGVKFNPAATGNKSANLRFTYSSGQTHNVPLTGQAINVSITEPVVEDFEGDVFPPLGWTITGDENNFNWRLMDSEPYAYSGNNSAMVGRDAGDYLLVSPVVNVANNNKTLSFFVRDHTYLETWDKDDEYLE